MTRTQALPILGVGLGYRPQLADMILPPHHSIKWLEVITEEFITGSSEKRDRLDNLARCYPLIPHGTELNIGGPDRPDEQYVRAVARLVEEIKAPWFSDHLCFTEAGGISLGGLMPIPRSRENAVRVAHRAREVQEQVGVPLILENISYDIDWNTGLTELEFILEFLEQCSCGLLLDVTNVYVNSINHRYEAAEFISRLPADRIVQTHLAGPERSGGTMLDTHSQPVPEEVWDLFRQVTDTVDLRGALLERDANFPKNPAELTGDLEAAATIMAGSECGGS